MPALRVDASGAAAEAASNTNDGVASATSPVSSLSASTVQFLEKNKAVSHLQELEMLGERARQQRIATELAAQKLMDAEKEYLQLEREGVQLVAQTQARHGFVLASSDAMRPIAAGTLTRPLAVEAEPKQSKASLPPPHHAVQAAETKGAPTSADSATISAAAKRDRPTTADLEAEIMRELAAEGIVHPDPSQWANDDVGENNEDTSAKASGTAKEVTESDEAEVLREVLEERQAAERAADQAAQAKVAAAEHQRAKAEHERNVAAEQQKQESKKKQDASVTAEESRVKEEQEQRGAAEEARRQQVQDDERAAEESKQRRSVRKAREELEAAEKSRREATKGPAKTAAEKAAEAAEEEKGSSDPFAGVKSTPSTSHTMKEVIIDGISCLYLTLNRPAGADEVSIIAEVRFVMV